ncbi:hypothetical protein HZZ02_23215, partial [Streptococcus danieliae]|nr:hypothetical protein [Streptococcus danieliae]
DIQVRALQNGVLPGGRTPLLDEPPLLTVDRLIPAARELQARARQARALRQGRQRAGGRGIDRVDHRRGLPVLRLRHRLPGLQRLPRHPLDTGGMRPQIPRARVGILETGLLPRPVMGQRP